MLVFTLGFAVVFTLWYLGWYWQPTNAAAPAAPTWATNVLAVTDNPDTEAVEAGYSVRAVVYLPDSLRAQDIAYAVNNLRGTTGLRAADGGNVLLLVVTGPTRETAAAEAQRWQTDASSLIAAWR
jgi:hypothetical protein